MFLGNTNSLEASLNYFNSFYERERNINLDDLSSILNCSKRLTYLYKNVFTELNDNNVKRIDLANIPLEPEILAAICLCPSELVDDLILHIEDIHHANNPFDKIDSIIEKYKKVDPLELLSINYWKEIGNYLLDRNIDIYPFSKNAAFFIKSIGNKGYKHQSEKQKKWIKGLLQADKADPSIKVFNNEVLKRKKLHKDIDIINNYMKCL